MKQSGGVDRLLVGVQMNGMFPQWVLDAETAFSLLGFIITLIVFFEVRRIKKSFLVRARLPDILKELGKAGSTLNLHIDQWPAQRNGAHAQIKIIGALLKTTEPMLPSLEKKSAKALKSKFDNAAKNFSSHQYSDSDAIWDIYSDLQALLATMTQLMKNKKWE